MNLVPTPTNITIQSGTAPVVLTVWCTDPTATTVVFYPGTMSGAQYYSSLCEHIVAQGCNVVGVNPLSHGDSPRSKYLFTFADVLQNGRDAVLWTRQHMTGPVLVAGHSQGGIAALSHTVASLERVSAPPSAAQSMPHSAPGSTGAGTSMTATSVTATTAPPSPSSTGSNVAANVAASVAAHSAAGTAPSSYPNSYPDAAFLLCTLLPQHPRAIEVTIFAPFAHWHAGLLRGIRKLARWLPWLPIMVPMYLSLRKIFTGSRDAVRPHGHMRAFYPLRFIASLFSTDLTGATRAGNITCPLSLISACNDALFTPDLQACMWDAIVAPHKQRIILSGGGHLAPFVPRYAAEIAAHMAARCREWGFPLSRDAAQHE